MARRPGRRALVLKDIAHLDTLLGKFAASVRASKTTAEHKAAVLANVAADRAALAELSQVVKEADATVTDLKQVRRDLKAYRVLDFQVAVNLLRRADALTATSGAIAIHAVKVLLSGPNADVEAVKDALAIGDSTTGDSTTGDSTTDEPTTDESTTEDPIVGDPVADPVASPSAVAVGVR